MGSDVSKGWCKSFRFLTVRLKFLLSWGQWGVFYRVGEVNFLAIFRRFRRPFYPGGRVELFRHSFYFLYRYHYARASTGRKGFRLQAAKGHVSGRAKGYFNCLYVERSLFLFLFPSRTYHGAYFLHYHGFFLGSTIHATNFYGRVTSQGLVSRYRVRFLQGQTLRHGGLLSTSAHLFARASALRSKGRARGRALLRKYGCHRLFTSNYRGGISKYIHGYLSATFVVNGRVRNSDTLFRTFIFQCTASSVIRSPLRPRV